MGNGSNDLNVAHELVNLHFQVHRLQVLVQTLLNRCMAAGIDFREEDVLVADRAAYEFAQSRFPDREIIMPETLQDNLSIK